MVVHGISPTKKIHAMFLTLVKELSALTIFYTVTFLSYCSVIEIYKVCEISHAYLSMTVLLSIHFLLFDSKMFKTLPHL